MCVNAFFLVFISFVYLFSAYYLQYSYSGIWIRAVTTLPWGIFLFLLQVVSKVDDCGLLSQNSRPFLFGRRCFDSSQVAATGGHSVAERSYPTSEVRGQSQEDPMPKGRQPRGVTPRLRSGAAANSARLR